MKKESRENAKALKEAFAWNKGFKEYLCRKSNPESVSDPDSSESMAAAVTVLPIRS